VVPLSPYISESISPIPDKTEISKVKLSSTSIHAVQFSAVQCSSVQFSCCVLPVVPPDLQFVASLFCLHGAVG
jgi:hypothetical protein